MKDIGKICDCILLVEDDSIANFLNIKIIENLLITKTIVSTENGEEALNYIRENSCPDLILLDINMPIMNGLEFLESFHKEELPNKGNAKIIVLTSSESMADKSLIESYGIPYMEKPLSRDSLLNIMSRLFKEG